MIWCGGNSCTFMPIYWKSYKKTFVALLPTSSFIKIGSDLLISLSSSYIVYEMFHIPSMTVGWAELKLFCHQTSHFGFHELNMFLHSDESSSQQNNMVVWNTQISS